MWQFQPLPSFGWRVRKRGEAFSFLSKISFFFKITVKPNENSQKQKQSSNCVFVVYSSRLLFYICTRVKLTSLNYCNLVFINDLKIWSELVGLLQLKINWSKMSYPMTFLQIKFFNKKERGRSGGQIRYLLSLADLRSFSFEVFTEVQVSGERMGSEVT